MKNYKDKKQKRNYKKRLSDKRKGNRMRNRYYEDGLRSNDERDNW